MLPHVLIPSLLVSYELRSS